MEGWSPLIYYNAAVKKYKVHKKLLKSLNEAGRSAWKSL